MADFAWTFPCYLIVAAGGNGFIFAAPDDRVAIFTDLDLCERFKKDTLEDDPRFVILPVLSARDLAGFLDSLRSDFRGVAVDSDHQKCHGFGFPQVIRSLTQQDL